MIKVVIIGAGSMALTAADVLMRSPNFDLAGFIGTAEEVRKLAHTKVYESVPVLGDRKIIPDLRDSGIYGFVAAIGDSNEREKAFYSALETGLMPINIVSSSALISSHVKIGQGVIICDGAIISHGVQLGDNVLIEPGALIDVNSMISSNVYVGPRAVVSGGVQIEKNVQIGAGAIIEAFRCVGKNNNILPGSVVREDMLPQIRGT